MSALCWTTHQRKRRCDVQLKKTIVISRIIKQIPYIENILKRSIIQPTEIRIIKLYNDAQDDVVQITTLDEVKPAQPMLMINVHNKSGQVLLSEIMRYRLSIFDKPDTLLIYIPYYKNTNKVAV